MLGTSSAGSEALKNLVLPAIGKFTVVCDKNVLESDFGNDFFVTREHLSMPKAQVVAEMLAEMNPDVQGNHVVSSVQNFIDTQAQTLTSCQLVIANDVT
jgi:NEDD8-activating enzyme E1 regulatory subunit